METVDIRRAASDDLPVLRSIFRSASLTNAGDRQALLLRDDMLRLADDLLDDGQTHVAVLAGTVVGFVRARARPGGVVELEDLFVDPAAMRRGVGRRLVQQVHDDARRRGDEAIEVTANRHAVPFYERVGFTAVGMVETELGPAVRMRAKP